MSKPLAGKRAFEAMGRSAYSRGQSLANGRGARTYWPLWARQAWAGGWMMQRQIVPKCRDCNGLGEVETQGSYADFEPPIIKCRTCGGTGRK